MEQSVKEGPAMIAEGWRGVRVDLKLVLGALSLELQQGLILMEYFFRRRSNIQNALNRKKESNSR